MATTRDPQLTVAVRYNGDFTKVIEAIDAAGGNVTAAARSLDIGKRTLCRWIETYPQLQTAVNKARRRK
jgi:transcriptional regulator of acetoin/glycerol metabolism